MALPRIFDTPSRKISLQFQELKQVGNVTILESINGGLFCLKCKGIKINPPDNRSLFTSLRDLGNGTLECTPYDWKGNRKLPNCIRIYLTEELKWLSIPKNLKDEFKLKMPVLGGSWDLDFKELVSWNERFLYLKCALSTQVLKYSIPDQSYLYD